MTDARYTSIHASQAAIDALDFDDPPQSGWGLMPGFDQVIEVPEHLEPVRPDTDDALPSTQHPSYPYGRPATQSHPATTRAPHHLSSLLEQAGEIKWEETALRDQVLEAAAAKEIPPGMAGAKRPPSPPSPMLRPSQPLQPRSRHLRESLASVVQDEGPVDPFDAPVPNETYAEATPDSEDR